MGWLPLLVPAVRAQRTRCRRVTHEVHQLRTVACAEALTLHEGAACQADLIAQHTVEFERVPDALMDL